MTLPPSVRTGPPAAGRRCRKPLLLIGAGDMAEVFAPAFENHPDFEIVGCVTDGSPECVGASLREFPLLTVEEALARVDTHAVLSIIGSPDKENLVSRFDEAGFEFASLFSALSEISPKADIEPGVVISSYTLIDPFTRIGRHSIVSVRVLVSHHSEIGPFCFIGPGTIIAGNTKIGARCFIGAGAILRDGIVVGDGATVGAGAVVLKDVEPGATVVGNPARPIVRESRHATEPPAVRRPLLILGAGDMATTYAGDFKDHPRYEIAGFVEESTNPQPRTRLMGLPVHAVPEALKLARSHAALCAIGSPARQGLIERFESAGFEFATLISPTAIVHGADGIEPGCVISDLANIDPDIRLGRHSLVTSRVTLAHHARVGAFSFLAPGATIGGHCRIGKRCFIGMGAIIRDHITLGDDVTVGAGAVVVRDVPDGQTVVGVPARILERSQK